MIAPTSNAERLVELQIAGGRRKANDAFKFQLGLAQTFLLPLGVKLAGFAMQSTRGIDVPILLINHVGSSSVSFKIFIEPVLLPLSIINLKGQFESGLRY